MNHHQPKARCNSTYTFGFLFCTKHCLYEIPGTWTVAWFIHCSFPNLSLLPASIPWQSHYSLSLLPSKPSVATTVKSLPKTGEQKSAKGYSGEVCPLPIKGIDTVPATSFSPFLPWVWSRCQEIWQPSWKRTDQRIIYMPTSRSPFSIRKYPIWLSHW